MLEQSALHGRIFRSDLMGKTLVSKPVPLDTIQFGPMRPVQIYRISDKELWVQDKHKGDWYHYLGSFGSLDLPLVGTYPREKIRISDYISGDGFFYYYGKALCDAKNAGSRNGKKVEQLYFVQNEPPVSYAGIPDVNRIQIPLTLQTLDYDRSFHYPEKIKTLLEGIPACYVDRYKRPIKQAYGRTYPIAMEQVKTTWKELPETTYPVVVDFGKTSYAVADLEPEHTSDDLAHFMSLPGFYEEETPRGGKHKVVRIDSDSFKFRYSPGLEIINQSQVTLYGIGAKWLKDDPENLDITAYHKIGHTEHQVFAVLERPDVSDAVKAIRRKAEENLSMGVEAASQLYRTDPDESHGEFVALRTLYKQDIKPYANQFPSGLLPWILESYASDVITHREKHETMRSGLPYLVYLAAIIIGKEDVKTWEGQSYISSEPVH